MKRKTIQLAGTLVVSLPSKWAKKHGVKKGDEINVEEQEGKLVIGTSQASGIRTQEISIKNDHFMQRLILNPYRNGVDELTVNYDSSAVLPKIHKALNMTIGFEVIKQGQKSCVLKTIATGQNEEFDNVLRRMFLMLLQFSQQSYEALKEHNKEALEEVKSSDIIIGKYQHFCERLLHKSNLEPHKLTFLSHVVSGIEQIMDRYSALCDYFSQQKENDLSKKALSLMQQTNALLQDYYELFYSYNAEKHSQLKTQKKLVDMALTTIKEPQEMIVVQQLGKVIDVLTHLSQKTSESHPLQK